MVVGRIEVGLLVARRKARLKRGQGIFARRGLKSKGLASWIEFHGLSFECLPVAGERECALDRPVVLIIEHYFDVQTLAAISLRRRQQFGYCDIGNRWTPGRQDGINLDSRGGDRR